MHETSIKSIEDKTIQHHIIDQFMKYKRSWCRDDLLLFYYVVKHCIYAFAFCKDYYIVDLTVSFVQPRLYFSHLKAAPQNRKLKSKPMMSIFIPILCSGRMNTSMLFLPLTCRQMIQSHHSVAPLSYSTYIAVSLL